MASRVKRRGQQRERVERPGLADRLRVGSIQAAALAVALVVAPGLLYSAVDLPKRILLETLVISAWLGAFMGLAKSKGQAFRLSGAAVPILAIAGWAAFSAFFAINTRLAMESFGLQLSYAGLGILIMCTLVPGELRKVLVVLMVSAGIEAVYGIMQYAGIDFLPWGSSWGPRCFGSIGNPIFFAEFLAPILILVTAWWLSEKDKERKDLLSLLIMGIFLALVFSQTRSAWVGAVAGLVVLGIGLWRHVPGGRDLLLTNRWWIGAFLGFGLAVIFTVSSKAVLGESALPLKNRFADALNMQSWTVQHRLVLWRAAGVMLRSSPLSGVGPGHYRSAFPLAQAGFRPAYSRRGFFFPPKETNAHNDYAQMAAEQGLIGLGMMIWLVLAVLRLGTATMRFGGEIGTWAAGMVGGCVCLWVDACFNFPFRVVPAGTVFWLFVGGIAVLAFSARPAKAVRVRLKGKSVSVVSLATAGSVAIGLAAWLVVPALRADRAFAAGIYYMDSRMWEMSAFAFKKTLATRPYDNIARYHLGCVLFKAGNYNWTGRLWDEALLEFEKAHGLGLNDEMLFGKMSLVFEKKMKYERCIEMGDRVLHIYPESMDMASNLAYWLSIRERDLDRADSLSLKAVVAVPEHPFYWWTRGLVLEKMGRYRQALDALRKGSARLENITDGARYLSEVNKDIKRVQGFSSSAD